MAEKTLIIAEKPSVANDLTKVLPGKFKKLKTHYEGDKYIVSFAIGHLVSICYPEEINPAYQKWDMANLPILPDTFPLKGLDGTKSQLNALQKLIRRKDISLIVNGCDAGREGELIFKYIIAFVWNNSVAKKSFKRLWLQSMTPDAIKKALGSLRDNDEMLPLEDAALCRSESDWLIGINATRALTGYNSRNGGFFLTPCGRVQTPTLSLLVQRQRARNSFVPKQYWTLQGSFSFDQSSYTGKWIDRNFKKDPNDDTKRLDRLWNVETCNEIVKKCKNKPATIEEKSKKSTQSCPPLYDLTLLQREANSRFGFSAKNSLSIAQALYERHKALTYPRTDSKHLPEDYLQSVKKIVAKQSSWNFGEHATTILKNKYIVPNKRIFNNTKITDHHAIIPTPILPSNLSDAEFKIYQMVVQRFLAIFFPAAIFQNTKRYTTVEDETFLTEGKILLEPGWKVVYGTDNEKGKLLKSIPEDSSISCKKVELEERFTTPPPSYNEATLLSAMENSDKLVVDEELADAMKERGLGTPATRAAIIEKLIKEKYVVRESKNLIPTGKAFELLALLEAMGIDLLASPEMTGEWEFKLNQILKGEFTRKQFMDEIREITKKITKSVQEFDSDDTQTEAPFSPINNQRFFSTPTTYISEDKTIRIRKILGGKILSETDVVSLIEGNMIGPYDDFRSKKGKPFTATVQLVNSKIEFTFPTSNSNLDIEAIKSSKIVGYSPIDKSGVFHTPSAYMSESALDGDEKNGLKISKIILTKEIEEKYIMQLLTEGKTELIKGFISKRKKPFDAYLILEKNGKIRFEFPPRQKRKKNNS